MSTHESMTPERLAEIRERVEKRTPGTWQWSDCDELIAQDGDDFASVIYGSISWPEDRDLIAHAPQDLTDLLAEVQRLRARLTVDDDMVEQVLRQIHGVRAWQELCDPENDYDAAYVLTSRDEVREALEVALGTKEDA